MPGEESLGEYLRREREARKITLVEVSEVTRIKGRYLEALETNEFGVIPAEPLVRGFLRAYARHLGLDAGAVVARYNREHQVRLPPERPLAPLESLDAHGSSGALWSRVVLVALFIVVGASFLWFVQGRSARTPAPGREEAVGSPPRLSPARPSTPRAVPGEIPRSPSLAAPPGATSPSSPPEATSPAAAPPPPERRAAVLAKPRELQLRVQAIEDTWIRIVVDNREPLELLLTAGDSRSWSGKEKFVLTVGNAAGTRLSLNGVSVKLPPTRTNVVHDFVITPKVLD